LLELLPEVQPNSTTVGLGTVIAVGSDIVIEELLTLQLFVAVSPVTVITYPAAVVVGARAVKVAEFPVVLVGAIFTDAPSKEVISKV
jgi:hypothetical protein